MAPTWHHILALAAAAGRVSAAQLTDPTSKDNSPDCQCYFVSGPDSGFFQYHRFWDFRAIGADGDNNYTSAPAVVSASQNTGADAVTSNFFNSSSKWAQDWAITQDVERTDSVYHIVNSPQNVFVSRNASDGSTYLTLRTVRLPDWQSTAEFASKQNNILHGSLRARFRIIPNSLANSTAAPAVGANPADHASTGSSAAKPVDDGAVAGFFTYLNDTQETDVEILTTEPAQYIHYTNQPDYIAKTDTVVDGASTNATLPDGLAYTDWIEHRIDWFDGLTRWYVNDQLVLNKSKNAPSAPSALVFNLWSDGGSWSGNMSVGGQVNMAVEWIQMVFNVSGDLREGGHGKRSVGLGGVDVADLRARDDATKCTAACNVDGVKQVGFPETATSATGTASGSNGTATTEGAGSPAGTSTGAAPAATSSSAASGLGLSFAAMPAYSLPVLALSLVAGVSLLL